MSILAEEGTDRIEIDEDYIEIKRSMSVGDLEQIARESDSEQTEARIISALVVCIKGWNLKDKKGNPLPTNRENIARLKPATAMKIFTEIGKRNPIPKV